jgi:hypothetical protein
MTHHTTGIRHREASEYKKPVAATGNLAGREVTVEDPSTSNIYSLSFWWELLKDMVLGSSEPQPLTHRNLKQHKIDDLTEVCIEQLKTLPNHKDVLRDWVVNIYRVHGLHLSAYRGEWMRDIDVPHIKALLDADEVLNPILIDEIKKLIPHSEEARSLHIIATTQKHAGPISDFIFHLEIWQQYQR